jgi:hypothetical protein
MLEGLYSYPKIFNLGHAGGKDLFLDNVIVQEKVDGSQFSFGIFNEELKCKSKGKEIIINAPEKMFFEAIETIQLLKNKLNNGWLYRGEYLQKPHHNTLSYERIPNNHIIIFDININEEEYLDYENVKKECERIGLECVPKFYEGRINNPDEVLTLLDNISILGKTKIEGLVFKNYNRFGKDGKVLMGKFVSEKFKEIHNKEWKEANPKNKDIIQLVIGSLKTDARWEKGIQHLKENGLLTNELKDIGKLIVEVQNDIKDECEDYIKQKLYNHAISIILRGCISGLPEWYKEKLLKDQF